MATAVQVVGTTWLLRSTLTLKTTDATLVSVDGDSGNGPMGALVHQVAPHLPFASPETITEMTPVAAGTPLYRY